MATVAILLSGQGAQTPGMGRAWLDSSPAASAVFQAAEALRPGTMAQCFEGPKEALTQTINAQPCLFCVDLAAAMAVREAGIAPVAVAGFSLGEIPALAFAGMLPVEDAFTLVCRRAEAMQACAAANPGGMLAVLGLAGEAVEALCASVGDAWPVNYNCPGQLVVAAKADRLPALREAVKAAGGKAMPLAVSGPFHTPLMAAASDAIAGCLAAHPMRDPVLPVYANATGAPYAPPYAALTARQAASPVRWEETLRALAAMGVDTFIEAGVGKALCGFVKRTLPDAAAYAVSDPESLRAALEALEGA